MLRAPITVAQHGGSLRDGSVGSADLDRLLDPVCAAVGQPASLQAVARGPVPVGTKQSKLRVFGRQDKARLCHARQLLRKFPERMQ